MAGSLSDFAEDEFNDHYLLVSAMVQPAGLFMALSTADPTDDGSGIAEPVGNGYVRVQFETWNAAAARAASNNGIIQWPVATGSQGTLTHWAMFDAITGGNMLFHGDLTSSVVINTGNRFEIPDATLLPTVSTGGWSTFLANSCIDHILLTAAYAQPAGLFVAAVTVAVVDADTGSTITEPGGGVGYARLAFSDFVASSGGASSNNTTMTFATATGAGWGNILGCPLLDAVTAGNLLGFGLVGSPQVIDADEIITFDPGDFDVTLN